MRDSLAAGSGTLYAFLLVLARISGAFVFVPLPGSRTGADIARLFAALTITIALLPFWPHFDAFPVYPGEVIVAVIGEAAFGLCIGVVVSLFNEMLMMAAQIISTQAGFSFASTIDPTTQSDSGLLVVIAQLVGGMLFLTLGLHREVIRIFASSLLAQPPGSFHLNPRLAEVLLHFSAQIFVVGLKLALPSIALLGLIDISLALVGRVNSQLQLLSLSFPIKMLAAIALMAVLAALYPRVLGEPAGNLLLIAREVAGATSNVR
jgi:flagellar biosynthetic protein FliR